MTHFIDDVLIEQYNYFSSVDLIGLNDWNPDDEFPEDDDDNDPDDDWI